MPYFDPLFQLLTGVRARFDSSSAAFAEFSRNYQMFNKTRNPYFDTAADNPPTLLGVSAYDCTMAMARAWNITVQVKTKPSAV
jgi:hypothetical protein